MHLIERYALNTGVKIDRPEVYQDYFPVPFKKFIVFAPLGKNHKKYLFWQEVVNLLTPVFEKNDIKILQVGADKNVMPFHGAMSVAGQTSLNNLSYIVDKSLLYLGVDCFITQISSLFDKKIVALYSHVNVSNRGPYWGSKENQILIEPDRKDGHKPCYSQWDSNDYINKIAPEKIAKAVCKLLNLEFNYPYNTIFGGKLYHKLSVDLVPTENKLVKDYDINANVSEIMIRMDWNHDEKNLLELLKEARSKCGIILNKQVPFNLLSKFSNKISEIVLIYDGKNLNQLTEDYVKMLDIVTKNTSIYSHENKEANDKFKSQCMDYAVLNEVPWPKKPKEIEAYNDEKIYFKSNKRVLANGKVYNCYYNYKNDIPEKNFALNSHSEIVDDKDFWKDVNSFHLLTKNH